jgi:hypothetical protein
MWFVHANLPIGPLGCCLALALSIPIGENGTIPLLTLNLTTITSMQIQNEQASRPVHVHTTMQPWSKNNVWKNVLVSIPICEIKKQKEWHWPPNIKKKTRLSDLYHASIFLSALYGAAPETFRITINSLLILRLALCITYRGRFIHTQDNSSIIAGQTYPVKMLGQKQKINKSHERMQAKLLLASYLLYINICILWL